MKTYIVSYINGTTRAKVQQLIKADNMSAAIIKAMKLINNIAVEPCTLNIRSAA